MGFYSQVIVPLLCDFGLDRPSVAKYRRELLTHASGNILEIGFGTGLNLPHYPKQVQKITTVDPNVGMYRRARRRIKQTELEVDQRVLRSERLPFEECTFDCVVSTFTLCSIEDVRRALAEVYRVLKPGGKFLFLGRPKHAASYRYRGFANLRLKDFEASLADWQELFSAIRLRLPPRTLIPHEPCRKFWRTPDGARAEAWRFP